MDLETAEWEGEFGDPGFFGEELEVEVGISVTLLNRLPVPPRTIQDERVRSQRTQLQGSAPARHVDVDFAIFWGWGKESTGPDHPSPTHTSTSPGTCCFRGFLRSSPSRAPRGFLQGFPQGTPLWGPLP